MFLFTHVPIYTCTYLHMYLFTHVEQKAIVNIVDAEGCHNYNRVDDEIFIAFHILKQKD